MFGWLLSARPPRGSPWAVAALVLVAYGWWLMAALRHGYDPRSFIQIGRNYLALSHASAVITLDPHFHYPPNDIGYDGQFDYYIALDPLQARYYVGDAAYCYGRILYPLTARLLALAQAALVPYTLLLVNWLALAGGTLAVVAWLRRKQLSPWFALVFGLYPGLFVWLHRDLTEPLAYALAALAIYLFDCGGRRRVLWAGLCFALAKLARETAAVFAIAYGLALLLPASGAGDLPAEPATGPSASPPTGVPQCRSLDWRWVLSSSIRASSGCYKGLLWLWLGSPGGRATALPELLPLGGIFAYRPLAPQQLDEVVAVVVPGLLCGALALWSLRWYAKRAEVWALLVNVLVFVVALNRSSYVEYQAAGRITSGVILAALLCLPLFERLSGGGRSWLWVSAILWFLPWYALVPAALGGS